MKKGDIVIAVPMGNEARRGNDRIVKAMVISMGPKYFKLEAINKDGHFRNRFSIETMREATEYTSDWQIYESEEQLRITIETPKLRREIIEKINGFSYTQLVELNQKLLS